MKQSTLAVIPARAQSKRTPGKNKKFFMGKPLIQWTIEAALDSKYITDVIVTTDDQDILSYQSLYPQVMFVARPEHLALDSTPGIDPVLDLMAKSEKPYENIILLQPTSPLRTSQHIDEAFDLFFQSGKKQLVSVKKMSEQLSHIVYARSNKIGWFKDHITNLPQDAALKVLNGAIYITDWSTLIKEKSFLSFNVEFYEMGEEFSVDIDTTDDWMRAERYARLKEIKNE